MCVIAQAKEERTFQLDPGQSVSIVRDEKNIHKIDCFRKAPLQNTFSARVEKEKRKNKEKKKKIHTSSITRNVLRHDDGSAIS